jgi:hypothetical protein
MDLLLPHHKRPLTEGEIRALFDPIRKRMEEN